MAIGTFKKGSIEMLTLLMLQERDIYGYQLIQMISDRSAGKLSVQEGSLYPLLYRMVDAGYISGRDISVETKHGRKRNRVLYHLEPFGRLRLIELKSEFDQVQEGIQNVFQNSAPIGYQRENVCEQICENVCADGEQNDMLPLRTKSKIPSPVGG